MIGLRTLLVLTAALSSSAGMRAAADDLAIPQAYVDVAARQQVPAQVLYVLALTESGRAVESLRRPWPWTLNVEGQGAYFETRDEALNAAQAAIDRGDSTDIGLMQVNWRVHAKRFTDLNDAFDPWRNLEVGAQILREYYTEKGQDWYAAIGRYRSKNAVYAQEHQTRFADNLTRMVLGHAK